MRFMSFESVLYALFGYCVGLVASYVFGLSPKIAILDLWMKQPKRLAATGYLNPYVLRNVFSFFVSWRSVALIAVSSLNYVCMCNRSLFLYSSYVLTFAKYTYALILYQRREAIWDVSCLYGLNIVLMLYKRVCCVVLLQRLCKISYWIILVLGM